MEGKHSTRRISIFIRIWLSIGILILGYSISMVVGVIHGKKTESRLTGVSEWLFPATNQSRLALTAFNEQLKLYEDAVISGETILVDSAFTKAMNAREAMLNLINLKQISDNEKRNIRKTINRMNDYTARAQVVYARMSMILEEIERVDSESKYEHQARLEQKAFALAKLSDSIKKDLLGYSRHYVQNLKDELASIGKVTRNQRYMNIILFCVVVVTALFFITFIISRYVNRPLQKTFMLETAVEQSTDGIAVLDLDGYLQFSNNSWAKMHGYSLEEVEGVHVSLFHTEEQLVNELIPFHNQVQHKGAHTGEVWHMRKDETVFPTMMTVNLIQDEKKPNKLVSIARDITEQKKNEEELTRAKETAEAASEALEESLKALKHAQDHLIQSEKMAALGGLVAGVAHEINTPIGVGVTAASYLEDLVVRYLDAYEKGTLKRSSFETFLQKIREASATMLKNMNRAADLIKNFKQVAVDQSSEKRRTFRLKEYAEGVLISLHPEYKRTGHNVEVFCPDDLTIDNYPGAFSQIITNLVMNSLIHGFEDMENGIITLDFTVKTDTLVFTYKDNGRGMEQEDVKSIFNPFYTTKRSHGGTGLGMHIVYNLVTQTMGGQITCESSPGEGVIFIIRIPLTHSDKEDNG